MAWLTYTSYRSVSQRVFYTLAMLAASVSALSAATPANAAQQRSVWIIVHGTFAESGTWYRPGGHFYDACKKYLPRGTEVLFFNWNGKNKHEERAKAGIDLADFITKNCCADDKIHLFGHSHGANVCCKASEHTSLKNQNYKIHRLFLLGAPVHAPSYSPNMEIVERVYNLFSIGDCIQTLANSYKRVFPDHPRIYNIRLECDYANPEHGVLHEEQFARHYFTLDKKLRPGMSTKLYLKIDTHNNIANLFTDHQQDAHIKVGEVFIDQVIMLMGETRNGIAVMLPTAKKAAPQPIRN